MKSFSLCKQLGVLSVAVCLVGTAYAGSHHDHDHGWDYHHPEKWGDLEVNKLCSTGQEQSPINITQVTVPADKGKFQLKANYQAQDFVVKNNGHTIVFDAKNPSAATLDINGTNYQLLQFHYHIPSEHTVMNASYPLEIHFVHQNANGGLAVVGVLVNVGDFNPSLNQIITNLPSEQKDGELKAFNIDSLMPKDPTVYAYNGSLTTPPCGEKVQWLLKAKPIYADASQLKVLAKLYHGNNRPVQPQNNRKIYVVE